MYMGFRCVGIIIILIVVRSALKGLDSLNRMEGFVFVKRKNKRKMKRVMIFAYIVLLRTVLFMKELIGVEGVKRGMR